MDPISIFSGLMMLSMATDLDRTKNYVTDLEGQIVQMELDQADAYEQMMEQKQAYAKHRSNITNSRLRMKKKNFIKNKKKN